ncbi:FAD-binding oxidoreductase [Polynucleobacter sp. IMCC 30228]|uniref:FAD-binding oxidoreductase n=1 Tax=Polynucleobacter sp. IMCC 30228 TaxID=2781011 RepID=UPI001F246FCA|nr:FAD-binding oxidoreductase [Polynucleobacter sp. IMCC 30228]MCE7527908.1 FAD-binding oxidoreductase [Polynucleobacter sp. IMCC 30228]
MQISGWGRYPKIDAEVNLPRDLLQASALVKSDGLLIPRGLGRAYGDSSLASRVLETTNLQFFHSFDSVSGILSCDAGVSLFEILKVFVPKGWFIPVSPGTRFVTVGGAIASDVHGKNHHLDGTFGQHVISLQLLLGNGEIVQVSPTENTALFHATCGGMGLTGTILSASFRLVPIKSSEIIETTIKAANLDAVLDGFEQFGASTYTVAWIDCLAQDENLGRSLLMVGEHAEDGPLTVADKNPLTMPVDAPSSLLNPFSIKAFNALYYAKAQNGLSTRRRSFESYFYPLDQILQWNKLYGKAGFMQYQFVIPTSAGREGLRQILKTIAASGQGSFLAVLKTFGKKNANYLSFPIEGYTLALDFKVTEPIFALMDQLDHLVLQYGGRLYLAKDARMSETTFKTSYPNWQDFEAVREHYHAIGKFASLQSKRLGLA